MTPRSLQFLKDCLKDVIVLLHIDIWCKLEQPVIVRRSAGSTQFLKDGSDNNTSLASLRFLKVVIAILLLSLYRNSTKGGSCLEDERELGEEIFFSSIIVKQGVGVFLSILPRFNWHVAFQYYFLWFYSNWCLHSLIFSIHKLVLE